MEVENCQPQQDEEPVVKHLVLTTQARGRDYAQVLLDTELGELNPCYFVSGCFPNNYKCKIGNYTKDYVCLKQHIQYHYIKTKFLDEYIVPDDIQKMLIIFEQTKNGNIHYHILVETTMHKHDLRASISELFGFKRAQDILLNIVIKNVNDFEGLIAYLYHKTTKDYEAIDQEKFKPIYLV